MVGKAEVTALHALDKRSLEVSGTPCCRVLQFHPLLLLHPSPPACFTYMAKAMSLQLNHTPAKVSKISPAGACPQPEGRCQRLRMTEMIIGAEDPSKAMPNFWEKHYEECGVQCHCGRDIFLFHLMIKARVFSVKIHLTFHSGQNWWKEDTDNFCLVNKQCAVRCPCLVRAKSWPRNSQLMQAVLICLSEHAQGLASMHEVILQCKYPQMAQMKGFSSLALHE